MNIDARHTHNLWFETPTGDVAAWDAETMEDQPPVDTYPYACSRFPLELTTHIYRRREEDGLYGNDQRIAVFNSSANAAVVLAMATGGMEYRYVLDRRFLSRLFQRPRRLELHHAIIVVGGACERCLNALAYLYGLPWGYKEGGPEWRRCGTSCVMCEDMGFSGRDREVPEEPQEED